MTGADPETLRQVARERLTTIRPGEILVVRVPPDWPRWQITDLMKALDGYASDPDTGMGIRVLVIPGVSVSVTEAPEDPFAGL